MGKKLIMPGANGRGPSENEMQMGMLVNSIMGLSEQMQTMASMMHLDSMGKTFGAVAAARTNSHEEFTAEVRRMCTAMHPAGCSGIQLDVIKYVDDIVVAHAEMIYALINPDSEGVVATSTTRVEESVKAYLEFMGRLREQEAASHEGKVMAAATPHLV